MPKRLIRRAEALSDPSIIWNAFLDLISDPVETLDPEQRPAHYVIIYDIEMQNGGHLQYFFNRHHKNLKETLSALTLLGAEDQCIILEEAAQLFDRRHPSTPQDFAAIAKKGEFARFDKRFQSCVPSLGELLGKHLTEHAATYIQLL
jgi:hypothetical protein